MSPAEGAAGDLVHDHTVDLLAGVVFCPQCAHRLESRLQEDRECPTCPQCGYIHYADPKVATAVVIHQDGGVLLGLRNVDPGSGKWSFPAGYVNRGEVVEEAAIREVLEETGLTVRLEGLVGVYSSAGDAVILVVYAGVITGGTPRADGHELSALEVFLMDALPDLAFARDLRVLEDWRRLQETGHVARSTTPSSPP